MSVTPLSHDYCHERQMRNAEKPARVTVTLLTVTLEKSITSICCGRRAQQAAWLPLGCVAVYGQVNHLGI